ncbi:hypothetical protein FRB99_006136 [Tulasnella sp. 403]|nr:hypothetical protein FRB99_006136 [Tulasnella sp. 403]
MLTIKYNVSISWDLATFPPLRSLTLDQITWQAPTFSQFIAFLQGRCRELETLVVRRVSFRDPLTPPQDPALDFPNLVTLSLSDIDKDLASFVVGSVQFHICRFFEIFVEVEIESSSSFFSDCLARASPALGSAASRFSGMEADLGVSPSGYSYDVALGKQYRFTLDVLPDYSNPDSVYQWTPESLARVAPVIPSLPLSVELHDSSCRWLQSDSVLRLEGIKSLHMAITSCEDTRLALERLGQPIVVDGVCRFPFPHLEVLRSGSAAPRDVLKMLINRQSYVVQGCQVEYPKGLKELYVSWEHKPDDE